VVYVEMCPALARKLCQDEVSEEEYRNILGEFEKDWKDYFVIKVLENIAELGGNSRKSRHLRLSMLCTSPQCFS